MSGRRSGEGDEREVAERVAIPLLKPRDLGKRRAHFWPNCIFNIILWQSKRRQNSAAAPPAGLPGLPLRVMNVRLQTIIFI